MHYEEQLEQDLGTLRAEVKAMGDRVQEAVKNAVHALLTGNRALANQTILDDGHINRDMRSINHRCHIFVARHLPSARHLRRISSIMSANISLERVGDYAVTICREQKQLNELPEGTLARDIQLLAEECGIMLQQSISAFEEENAELAKGTMTMADQIEHTFSHIFPHLLALGEDSQCDLRGIFALYSALTHIERISDQAKNICEDAVFLVTGEEKPFKTYNVLFLDETNDCVGPMAEAIARKAFPGSGMYTSKGTRPAEELHPGMVEFMERHGYSFTNIGPQALELLPNELENIHVIVSLSGPISNYIPEVPFHTVDVEWDLPTPPSRETGDDSDWREVYEHLLLKIRHLMETLRGKGAP